MSVDFLAFASKRKQIVSSMASMEQTFATYQSLQRMNLVANAISEIAEGDPKLLGMIAADAYSAQELITYANTNHPKHPAWAFLIMHHQILNREDLDDPEVAFTVKDFSFERLGLELDQPLNAERFKHMLYSMSTSRPDLSGKTNIHLAMAGGGAKGFGHVGMMKSFEDHGLWDKIETVAGTSAGGLIAALAALGYKPREIEGIVHEKDFSGFIYEFKSILGKIAHVASPLTSSHRLLRNVAFLDEFTKFMIPEIANYALLNPNVGEWERNLLLTAKENGQQDLNNTLVNLLRVHYSQEDMLFMIDKMDKKWMLDATAKCTKLAEESLGVQRPEDNVGNKWYGFTKLTPSNMWYGMEPYMKFNNPRDAINTAMTIMSGRDTVKSFMGRIIYEKVKALSLKCQTDPELNKRFISSFFESKTLPEKQSDWPAVTDQSIAGVTFRQLDRLRENFPEEGFKKLVLTFCERDGTILNKNNITAVSVDAHSEKYANMKIVDAMCATMRLPVVFSPYVFEEPESLSSSLQDSEEFKKELDRYFEFDQNKGFGLKPKMIKAADGGLLQNFPMKALEDRVAEPRQVVGFFLAPEQNFLAAQDANELSNPRRAVENPGENAIITYLRDQKQNLAYFKEKIHGDKQVSKYQLSYDQQIRVGVINVKEIGTVDFNMNSVQKAELIDAGYDTSERILRQQTAGRSYDINTAFWAEKFMAKMNQFEKQGLVAAIDTPELKARWESIQKLKGRVGRTTSPGLSI